MDTQTFELSWLEQTRQRNINSNNNERIIIDESYIVPNNGSTIVNAYVVNDIEDEEEDDDDDVILEESSGGLKIAAAENLIQLANDVSVLTHINDGDGNQAVFVAADGTKVDCSSLINVKSLSEVVDSDGNILEYSGSTEDYERQVDEMTEEVTEEIITDDWVQHQGEERVEISADQVIGTSAHHATAVEVEVPLRSVQDEYSARRPFPCDFCSRRFRKETSLEAHMIAHQNIRPNLCKLCGSRFSRRSELLSHLESHAEGPESDIIIPETNGFNYIPSSREQRYTGQQQQQQPYIIDHYYENDFHNSAKNSHRYTEHINNSKFVVKRTKLDNDSGYTTSFSSHDLAVPRGRISRLKPKIIASIQPSITTTATAEEEYFDGKIYQTSSSSSNMTSEKYIEEPVAKLSTKSPANDLKYPILCDSKPFVCQQCGLAFGRQKAYESHLKNHRNDSPLECDQCNEAFWDEPSLEEHKKTHIFDDSNSEYAPDEVGDTQSESETEKQQMYGEFFCGECGISFHRKDLLTRHVKNHIRISQSNPNSALESNKDQHCCNTCGETFPEALDLLAHAEIHARYAPFKCVLCGESFFEEDMIKKHLQTLHANKMSDNSCILCGKQCRDRKALMKHAWDHSREKSHSCPKCGKNFHNKARLKRHMASHRDKTVKCEVCQEEFPDGRSLSNHRHSHSTTSGKLFPCNECGKTFGSRSSQQIHVRIHTGEKPYGCRFCWKAFADGGTLRKHERIHTGEKPYACSVCPRAFNQRVVLREHIRSHHSGRDPNRNSYFCMVCGEEMANSNALISHLIGHSDVNTAMQRQPVTGPRKYKRRRKLKPHEIERLRKENKDILDDTHTNSQENSDVDISDLDVTEMNDFLDVPETETRTKPSTSRAKNNRRVNGKVNKTNNQGLSKMKNETDEDPIAAEISASKFYDQILNYDGLEEKFSNRKRNEDNFKLLTNVEDALERIEPLVVSEGGNSCDNNYKGNGPIIIDDDDDKNKTAQRTQQVQLRRSNTKAQTSSAEVLKSKKKSDKSSKNVNQGARMIHTEKAVSDNANNNNSRRSRPIVRRTESQNLSLLTKTPRHSLRNSAMTIVDEHEIMSPATQPPHQISSSPVHLRNDYENNSKQQKLQRQIQRQQTHQNLDDNQEAMLVYKTQLQQQQHQHRRRYLTSQSSQTSRSSDLYDAQLLLEASSFRKDSFSDLEDILRSPSKADGSTKTSNRNRLTSECSTQYIAEHCIDESHLIKIEPTSPDLHEIFNSCSNTNISSNKQNNNHEHQRTSQRNYSSMRSSRPITRNRRYLDFTDNVDYNTQSNLSDQMKRKSLNGSSNKLANGHQHSAKKSKMSSSAASTSTGISKSNDSKRFNLEISSVSSNGRLVNKLHAITKQNLTETSTSSMDRLHFDNHHQTNVEINSSYDSFSTIVNVAAAAAAASSMNSSSSDLVASGVVTNDDLGLVGTKIPQERKPKYFECEMCSAVFSDRAQLLEHVPIHI